MRLLAEDVRKNDGLISVLSNRKGIKTKVGKRFLSRRYNLVPLLRSRPGGIPRELAVRDLPIFSANAKLIYLLEIHERMIDNFSNFN